MRARGIGVLSGVMVILAVWGAGRGQPPARARALVHSSTQPVALGFRGAPSCAASACHGRTQPAPGPPNKHRVLLNEYTTWIVSDKHARAYQTLFNEQSQSIAALLPGGLKAHENPRCLACHTTPAKHLGGNPSTTFSSDGVGCESCHGAADRWYGEHTRIDWTARSPEAKELFGMVATTDVARRAAACARCHVGSPARDGLPSRDVDHDLIAAGHPRLAFEFSAYLANMPPHWNTAALPDATPDFPARSWAVAQLVSARAAVDLLRDRVSRTEPNVAWPEFSEYGCFSCHHDLRDDSWRRPPDASPPLMGRPRWGSWHYALLPAIAKSLPEARRKPLEEQLHRLASLMSGPQPSRTAVANQATETSRLLDTSLSEISKSQFNAQAVRSLIESLPQRDQFRDWDEAAQSYLALVPLSQTMRSLAPSPDDDRRRDHLQRLRAYLQYPKGFDSPRLIDPTKAPSIR